LVGAETRRTGRGVSRDKLWLDLDSELSRLSLKGVEAGSLFRWVICKTEIKNRRLYESGIRIKVVKCKYFLPLGKLFIQFFSCFLCRNICN
jgi:hypothetical protein